MLLVALLFVCPSPRAWAGDAYVLGVMPRYSPVRMYRRLYPLASYLQQHTGIQFQVRPYSTFDAFISGVKRGEVDVAFEDPVVALHLIPKMEPFAVVVGAAHSSLMRGMVVVPKDSKAAHLRDLKGQRVAVVSFLSAGGFVSQAISLARMGLNPFTDLDPYEAVRNSQGNVLLEVAMGEAGAGFVDEEVGKALIRKLSLGDSLRILGYTAWVPRWVIAVRRDLSIGARKGIMDALLAVPQKAPALNSMGIKGFIPAHKVDLNGFALQVNRIDAMMGAGQGSSPSDLNGRGPAPLLPR